MLNNCKKGKSFLSKYAIYRKFQISSFGLTCFAKPRLAYLCSFCSKWVREKKNEGREKDVFKTYVIGTFIRRSDWDVFPCFQFEPDMKQAREWTWSIFLKIVLFCENILKVPVLLVYVDGLEAYLKPSWTSMMKTFYGSS